MRLRQRQMKITRNVGFGLAAGALVWLAAGEAFSAAAFNPVGGGGGGGPRLSTPNIGSVGPRGPNFRVGPMGPKGQQTGNPSRNPETGKPPKGNPEVNRK